ncbi:MAG: hypothetical protein K2N71_03630 [Oscillospiraceae bacterium]|nr:hypothetical protein [Oscillospiraceae bacterium]
MENIPDEKNYDPYNEISFAENAENEENYINKISSETFLRRRILDAFQIAATFYPAHMLVIVLSMKTNLEFHAVMVCSVLAFIAILSAGAKRAGLKLLVSLPIMLVLGVIVGNGNFYLRAYHWAFPSDDGSPSMGGLWASGFLLIVHIMSNLFALIVGLCVSCICDKIKSEKVVSAVMTIKKICTVICAAIVITAWIFVVSLPNYVRVYG